MPKPKTLYDFISSGTVGVLGTRYEFPQDDGPAASPSYDLPIIESLEEAIEIASTGAPIAFPIRFIGKTYKRYDRTGNLVDYTMPDFRLPALVVGSFSREKLIQITDLGSGRGSVKEVDGHSDWRIELVGIVVPEKNHPEGITTYMDMLQHMTQWDSLMSSIEVSSDLLTALGIYKVVIKSIGFAQQEGVEDNADFTMSLLSDEDFEIEIIE